MALYTSPFSGITTGTAIKTLVQIAAPATTRLRVVEWSVSFSGTSAAAPPVLIQLNRQTTAGTGGVAANENPVDAADPTSVVTALSGPTAAVWTAEPTAGVVMFAGYFTPVGLGPFVQYAPMREILIPASGRLGITVTLSGTAVNCSGHITWDE